MGVRAALRCFLVAMVLAYISSRKGRLAMDGSTHGDFAEKDLTSRCDLQPLQKWSGYVLGPYNIKTTEHRGGLSAHTSHASV